jgi:hypothetical protein
VADVVIIAKTKSALAKYLPNRKCTKEQSELWDLGVIGSPSWLVTTARTLVLTVTLSRNGNLLHESCTERIYRLALISL